MAIGAVLAASAAEAIVSAEPRSMIRSVDLTLPDGTSLAPFYEGQTLEVSPEGGALGHQHLGVRGSSPLLDDVLLQSEVSIASALKNEHALDDRHLARLRLEGQWRDVDVTARLFSVGADVAANPIAVGRLESLGLPHTGDGGELRLGFHRFGIDITPRLQRVQSAIAEQQTSMLQVGGARWNAHWKAWRMRELDADGWVRRRQNTAELGVALRLTDAVQIAPRLQRARRSELEVGLEHTQLVGIHLGAVWPDLPVLNLNLEYRTRSTTEGTHAGYAVTMGARRLFRLAEDLPARLAVDTSLSYRRGYGLHEAPGGNGVGLQVSFELMPGRSSR